MRSAMHQPAVTILLPSYNYVRYIPVALKSALSQTFTDFELLVVEDGSTDRSLPVVRAFAERDARVRVLTHPDGKNHGLPASLALGLDAARGRWIAFLEADDLWRPDCLQRRMEALHVSGATVVLNNIAPLPMPGASLDWFDGYVPRVMRWHATHAGFDAADMTPLGFAKSGTSYTGRAYELGNAFLLENKIPTFSCAMVRTADLRAVSLDSPVPRWMDWWIWAQLAQRVCFAFVPEKLTRWRLHAKSWNARVRPEGYMEDYRAMGKGFRRLFARSLLHDRQWQWLAFLSLPSSMRIAARLAQPLMQEGLVPTVHKVWSRLNFSTSFWKL